MKNITDEQIRKAIIKDFRNLYQKGYTIDWEAKRIINEVEVSIIPLDNIKKLFGLKVGT